MTDHYREQYDQEEVFAKEQAQAKEKGHTSMFSQSTAPFGAPEMYQVALMLAADNDCAKGSQTKKRNFIKGIAKHYYNREVSSFEEQLILTAAVGLQANMQATLL